MLDAPSSVPAGSAITLSGDRSADVGGQIVRYVGTRLEGSGGSLQVNQPVETTDPTLTVENTPATPVGRHRFRLEVVDDSGNRSQPDEVEVFVLEQEGSVIREPVRVAQLCRRGDAPPPGLPRQKNVSAETFAVLRQSISLQTIALIPPLEPLALARDRLELQRLDPPLPIQPEGDPAGPAGPAPGGVAPCHPEGVVVPVLERAA